MNQKCRFIPSSRLGARENLQDEDGYVYVYKYTNKANTKEYYQCIDMMAKFCRTRAIYYKGEGGFIQSISVEHTHPPDRERVLVNLVERSVIDAFVDNTISQPARGSEILVKVLRTIEKQDNPGAMLRVSRKAALKSKHRRALLKANAICTEKLPQTWQELKSKGFPAQMTVDANGALFLR